MAPSKNTIVSLLNHLIKERRDISWKMGVGYHNGVDISIYEIKNNKMVSKIAFNGENGNLLRMKTSGYRQKVADNVVDAILDLSNYLKTHTEKSNFTVSLRSN